MWMLDFLPDFIFDIILAVGVLGIIASFVLRCIPVVSIYSLPVQIVAILLTVVGVWYEGGIAKDKEYRQKITDMKVKVAESEKKAVEATGKIVIQYSDRVHVIHDVQTVIKDRIVKVSQKIDSECKVDKEAINILNASARNDGGNK